MTRRKLWNTIMEAASAVYERREARAVTARVCEDLFGMRFVDVVVEPDAPAASPRLTELDRVVRELRANRPMQYIVGWTEFCGLRIGVAEGVLVPRPETEELVAWILAELPVGSTPNVLDIGTGSGAIALALAAARPQAAITATDVSAAALETARRNAETLGLPVLFIRSDILHETPTGVFDVIVSNPPYVTESERAQMAANVLGYEPAGALFVPDDDPLRFHRAIARKGINLLHPGGALYFEINERFDSEIPALLKEEGYTDTELRNDFAGKPRMLRAHRPA